MDGSPTNVVLLAEEAQIKCSFFFYIYIHEAPRDIQKSRPGPWSRAQRCIHHHNQYNYQACCGRVCSTYKEELPGLRGPGRRRKITADGETVDVSRCDRRI